MKKNFISLVLSVFVFVSVFSISTPVLASTLSQTQINAIVSLLQAFGADASIIADVTASLNGQPTTGPATNNTNSSSVVSCIDLNNTLNYGSIDLNTNGEVTILQDFLQSNGYLSVNSTGYYGVMTVNAVKAFQAANGISQAGFVGVETKVKIKELTCGSNLIITVPSSNSSPVITSFYASPSTINLGQSTTLSWTTTNATACYLEKGALNPQGSYTITNPVSSFTTTLYCVGNTGTTTKSVNVTVNSTNIATSTINNNVPILNTSASTNGYSVLVGDSIEVTGNNFMCKPQGVSAQFIQNGKIVSQTSSDMCDVSIARFIVPNIPTGSYQVKIINDSFFAPNVSTGYITLYITNAVVAPVTGTDLKIAMSATSPTGNINPGTSVTVAKYVLQNTTNMPAVVSSLVISISSTAKNISNLYLMANGIQLNTPIQPQISGNNGSVPNNISVNITIPAGASVELSVKADLSPSVNQNFFVSLTGATANIPVVAVYPLYKGTLIIQSITTTNLPTITASAGGGGKIVSAGTWNIPVGGSQTFSISPDTGYVIADVKIDGISNGAISTYTFSNVTSNHTIIASFSSVSIATQPTITSLSPTSGMIGTQVTINGSGFTNNNTISFVGSTNIVAGSNAGTASPINGEVDYTGVYSPDGKTLNFTVPNSLLQWSENIGSNISVPMVSGKYYVVVSSNSGRTSGVSYIDITVPVVVPTIQPSLMVGKNAAFANSNTQTNMTKVKIGSYVIRAGTSESVTVAGLSIGLTGSVYALSNLYATYDGNMTSVILPSTGNNVLGTNIILGAGMNKVIDIYSDISVASGTITTSLSASGFGMTSGNSVSTSGQTGQTITVLSATNPYTATSCTTQGTNLYNGQIGCDIVTNGTIDVTNSYCISNSGMQAMLQPDTMGRANRYYATLNGLSAGDPIYVYIRGTTNLIHCTPNLNLSAKNSSIATVLESISNSLISAIKALFGQK